MTDSLTFRVYLPTEDGFLGRKCSSIKCGRYFKVHASSLKERIYCPYCGIQFRKAAFTTPEQDAYVRRVGIEKAKEYMYGEIDKMFGRLAKGFGRSKNVRFEHKPIRYRARRVLPHSERRVDSELECPGCEAKFQVYGIFGFCPGCRVENMLIYDANIAVIRQEIQAASDSRRALRRAYADLVTTFESFAKCKAALLTDRTTRFQDLFAVRRFFKEHAQIDILADSEPAEILTLRRVFQKRHAYEHSGGMIDERYVRLIPEDRSLLGQRAELTNTEFERAAAVLQRVVDRLSRSVEPSLPI